MDKFSASVRHSVEKLLEFVTIVEVSDIRTFLEILSEDESIDVAQKMRIIDSIMEVLGTKTTLQPKKRYIKRRIRQSFNKYDSTSSDDEINSRRGYYYTRPYRQYKQRKYTHNKRLVDKYVQTIEVSAKDLEDCITVTSIENILTKKPSVTNLNLDKNPTERFLDTYIKTCVSNINYMTTVPVNYINLRSNNDSQIQVHPEITQSTKVLKIFKPVDDEDVTASTSNDTK